MRRHYRPVFFPAAKYVTPLAKKPVQIRTDDDKTYTAKVVGKDPAGDLALLKVDGRSDFPHVKFADEQPRVGEWVLAIGNAFGLGGSVTAGIVSARERNIGTALSESLIQIDAAASCQGSP